MNTIPAELNAIAGQLQNYDAPEQTVQLDSDCKLTYEILQWTSTHPDGLTDDRPIGTVEISRYNKESGTEYQIVEKRNGGGREIYEATVTTARDERIGESIQNWKLDWYQAETPDKRLLVNGTSSGRDHKNRWHSRQKAPLGGYPHIVSMAPPLRACQSDQLSGRSIYNHRRTHILQKQISYCTVPNKSNPTANPAYLFVTRDTARCPSTMYSIHNIGPSSSHLPCYPGSCAISNSFNQIADSRL